MVTIMVFAAKWVLGPRAGTVVAGYAFFFLCVQACVVSEEIRGAGEDGAGAFLFPAFAAGELAGVAVFLGVAGEKEVLGFGRMEEGRERRTLRCLGRRFGEYMRILGSL